MSIDPRLMERRKTIAEHKAKRNVTRLLKFLVLCLLAGSIVWVLFSPWLSIREVETSGISMSATHSILADTGVVAGTPTISIRTGAAEAALLEDPWIAAADVTVHWPDRVVVTVNERTPLAWVRTSGGWARRAIDGLALPSGETPDEEMAWIDLPDLADEDAPGSLELAGSLEFVEALPLRRHRGAVVSINDGELWANVTGHQVRLGRAVEMREKALSLDALLDETVPANSVLVLIAPTNPAVKTPTPDDPDENTTTP